MKTNGCFLLTAALLSGVATAAGTGDAPFAAPNIPYLVEGYDESTGLGYEGGLGVDPVYSTPSIYEKSGNGYPRFLPNDMYMEYFGAMDLRNGHGDVQVTNAVLTIPFVNPKETSWAGWHLDVKGTARLTWIDSDGQDLLDEDRLYTLGVQAMVARQLGERSRLLIGLTPQFSSDFDVMTHHNFFYGGYAAFSSQLSDKLRYTVGLAVMPDYFRNAIMPLVSLQWRYTPNWELRIEGGRLSSVCVSGESFQWGPFVQWNSGVWTVQRDGQTQQFRMTNCILGMGATYDHKLSSGMTLGFMGDLGATLSNEFRVRDESGRHSIEKYRADPGLYARFGCRVSF